jgi:Holliday junction resolvase RusA-like endonuclease
MTGLWLPEPPSANRWWRKFRNRMVLSPAARTYKAQVVAEAALYGFECIPQPEPVAIRLDWFRGRKSGDLDKRIGILLDALQGVLYGNDNQIVAITARRFDDKNKPGVHVMVSRA